MTCLAELTPRQIAVAALVAKGQSDKAIAEQLGMGERRVQVHIAAIAFLCKFDPRLNTRVQLALWYREQCPISAQSDVA